MSIRADSRLRGMLFVALCICAGGLGAASEPALASGGDVLYGSTPPMSFTGGEGALANPAGIAVEEVAAGHEGDVYVVDRGNNRVERFNASGTFLGEFNGSGTLHGEGGKPAAAGTFSEPTWVAIDNSTSSSDPSKGDVYVVDSAHNVIEKFSPEGEFLASLAVPPEGFEEETPNGVAVDNAGDVWVLNYTNVDKYDNAVGNAFVSSWSIEKAGIFSSHPGFGVDASDNVYLSGTFHKWLLKFTGAGAYEGSLSGECGEECALALAVDQGSGELLLAHFSKAAGMELQLLNASGAELQEPFGVGQLKGIGGLALNTTTHTLYATDSVAGDVKVFQGVVLASVAAGILSEEQPTSSVVSTTVNPNGQPTTCEIEYGPDTSYGTSVPCGPESVGSGTSPVPVTATLTGLVAGQTYHYRVVAANPSATAHGEDQSFKLTVAPQVDEQLGFASNVAQFSATLNGTIDSYGIPTSYHFVYGTTTAYGSSIPVPDTYTQAGTVGETVVPQEIGGLQPGTTYHFALVATSSGGTVMGPDEMFTTLGIPLPEALTGPATGASVGAVTLSGSVNPDGWDTTYQFQYGTSAAYGAVWPSVPVQAGQFTGQQKVAIYLQNLQPTTTYHYRLVATNPAGTVYGTDQNFTTSAYPFSAIAEPPSVSNLASKTVVKVTTTQKTLTSGQKLANALKACRKLTNKKRLTCEKRAHKKYPQTKKQSG